MNLTLPMIICHKFPRKNSYNQFPTWIWLFQCYVLVSRFSTEYLHHPSCSILHDHSTILYREIPRIPWHVYNQLSRAIWIFHCDVLQSCFFSESWRLYLIRFWMVRHRFFVMRFLECHGMSTINFLHQFGSTNATFYDHIFPVNNYMCVSYSILNGYALILCHEIPRISWHVYS